MRKRIVFKISPALDVGSTTYSIAPNELIPPCKYAGGLDSVLKIAHRWASWQPSVVIVMNRDGTVKEAREYVDPRELVEDGAYAKPHVSGSGKVLHVPISIPPDSVCC